MEPASRHRVRCALFPYKGPRTLQEAGWYCETEDEVRVMWGILGVLKAKGNLSAIPQPFPEDVSRQESLFERLSRLERSSSWHRREDLAFKHMAVQKFEELSPQKPQQDIVLRRPTFEL
jgi:hypothetical protein